MSKGGDLVIRLRTASDDGIDLSIEDTGSGVPEEMRASILDPFFTTKQRGTGLGLAVTGDIIEAHHRALHGLPTCSPAPCSPQFGVKKPM